MYWNYLELADGTRISYGDIRDDGTVPIAVERPVEFDFCEARCSLPLCRWSDVSGFSEDDLRFLEKMIRNNAPLIYELAEQVHAERTVA